MRGYICYRDHFTSDIYLSKLTRGTLTDRNGETLKWACIECSLATSGDTCLFSEPSQVLEHMQRHEENGNRVPNKAWKHFRAAL